MDLVDTVSMKHQNSLMTTQLSQDFETLTRIALAAVARRGVEYADVRLTTLDSESVSASNGQLDGIEAETDTGFGIRVLYRGAWGFAASPVFGKSEIERVARAALDVARASYRLSRSPVRLSPRQPVVSDYTTPLRIDPFSVPLPDRIALLETATDRAATLEGIQSASASILAQRHTMQFASLDGSRIRQTIVLCGGGLSVTAGQKRDVQTRSFPSSHGGDHGAGGYERILEMDLPGNARRVAEEALLLLSAPPCPNGAFTVILDGDQLGLQIHESIGHPLELDRVFGAEANFSGTSFASPDQLGSLRYASDIVSVVTDPTIPGGLGSYGFDDDGTPARRVELIRNGILVGFLSGRETASRIGALSSANNRAAGWRHVPINRMSNTVLLPGTWSLDDLLADTESGLFLTTNRSWSIDDRRESFRFECEAAYEIRGGKLGQMYRNPVYTGRTVDFWNRCDAICNETHFKLWGTPNCGKGEPSQSIFTSQGACPARFRNVAVESSAGKSRGHGGG